MAKNKKLHQAKSAKNDEFYTQLTDIEKELKHYKHHFKGKTIFCNCDDPKQSNFWKYFHLNFNYFGLKKLIATHFHETEPTYKIEYTGEDDNNCDIGVVTNLETNGDFRSPECIELLKEADIIVTNPPFSLFREYIAQLMKYDKKFIIIGNKNAITYKEFFPLLKDDEVWIGCNSPSEFSTPVGITKKLNGLTRWFTNLDITKRHEFLDLIEKYTPEKYPKYDNYEAINVDKTLDIPVDYDGVMGVPITFLDKYNPEQFEILGISGTSANAIIIDNKKKSGRFYINNKRLYDRILIKKSDICEAIKTLEEDISVKQEQIAKLKDFAKLSANGLSEDQYHEFCETNLRYTNLLGEVLVKSLPFLTYESRGASNFFYTLEGQKVTIPNSLCYGVELHLQNVHVSPKNEKERILKGYTSLKEHREERIATREAYLVTKNLIKKARIIFPTYRPFIAMVKYLFKAPFKHYRTEVKKQLEELIQLNQRAEANLNEKIKTIDFEYEKQQAFLEKYVPLLLQWTQTEVRIYENGSQMTKFLYKLEDGNLKRLER